MLNWLWSFLFGLRWSLDCCCGTPCLTNADVGRWDVDIESDCPTMDCGGLGQLVAVGASDISQWSMPVPDGCSVQALMTCEDGVYNLELTIPMCVVVNLTGSVISDPGDPVVIYFPPVSFTGNMFCCSPGTYTVEVTVTQS